MFKKLINERKKATLEASQIPFGRQRYGIFMETGN